MHLVKVRLLGEEKHRSAPNTLSSERERRSHIRRWAAMMITHLERSEFDDARHYGYEEALERLQALIARELDEVRGNRSSES